MSSWPWVVVRKSSARKLGSWAVAIAIVAMAVTGVPPAIGLPASSGEVARAADDFTPNWTELSDGWRIISADQVQGDDAAVSSPNFDASHWHAVRHMPATVLEILQEDGVYNNLYVGMNLVTPGDLWKKDWWYRTSFTAPADAKSIQ